MGCSHTGAVKEKAGMSQWEGKKCSFELVLAHGLLFFFLQQQGLYGVPASSQKCQAEGTAGINLNTSAGYIPRHLSDVITCFAIIHTQTGVHMQFLTTRIENVEKCCKL